MWVCARCGERIADDLDFCGKCGASRGPKDDAGEPPGGAPSDQPLTEAGFATVLLRLLGVCMAAFGAIALTANLGHVAVRWYKMGQDHAFDRYSADFFIYPVCELLVGIYFLIDGHWVFEKIMTPVTRRRIVDETEDLH